MSAALHLALRPRAAPAGADLALGGRAGLMLAVPFPCAYFCPPAEAAKCARGAERTPLVLGARGSALDLMLTALYFKSSRCRRSVWARWRRRAALGRGA